MKKNRRPCVIRAKYIIKKNVLPTIYREYEDIMNDNNLHMESVVNISDITLEEFLNIALKTFNINKEFVYLSILFVNEYIIKNLFERNMDKKNRYYY